MFAFLFIPDEDTAKTGGDSSSSVFSIFRKNPVLYLIYGFMLLLNIFLYLIVIYLPQILEHVGITTTFQVGIFLSAMGISAGVTASQYDKIKSRLFYQKIIPLSLTLWSAAFLLIFLISSKWSYGIAVIIYGVGQGMGLPTTMLWVGDVVPSLFLGRFSSYLTTFGFLGQFLSPIVFAPVAGSIGLSAVFLAAATVSLVSLFFSIFGLRK